VFAPPVAKGVKGKVQNEFTVNTPTDVVTTPACAA
jgi:hypothetical protein